MKFSPERTKIILDAIRNGNTRKTAAALARIERKTLYDWLNKGKQEQPPDLEDLTLRQLRNRAKKNGIKDVKDRFEWELRDLITEAEAPYYTFYKEMQYAQAVGVSEHLDNIREAGKEDWRASAWYLERTDPENFARRDNLKVENQHSGSIETQHNETYRIELLQKFEQDPKLQELYMQIWEREHIGKNSSGTE